jgi:hypothetical protein
MIIVDTSVWIEFLKGNKDTQELLIPYLRKGHVIAISPIFGELLQGVKNHREKEVVKEFWNNLPKLDEDDMFIKAGELSKKYKLYAHGVGLIDCYLLAAALTGGFTLLTLDKKLEKAIELVSV